MKIGTVKSFARVYHTNGQYARTSLSDMIYGDIRTSVILRQGTNDNDREITIELRGVDPLAPMCSIRLTNEDIGALSHPSTWNDGTFEMTGRGRSGLYDSEALNDSPDLEGAPMTLTFERTGTNQDEQSIDVRLTHPNKGVSPITTHFTSQQARDFLDILDEVSMAASRQDFLEFISNDTASFVDASGEKHPLSLFKQLPEEL